MNTEDVVVSHSDEVVFESRNKAYGAYAIRRTYHENLSKGTFMSFLFVALLFAIAQAAMMFKQEIRQAIADPGMIITYPPKIIAEKVIQKTTTVAPPVKTDLPVKVVTKDVVVIPPTETTSAAVTTTGKTEGVGVGTPLTDVGTGISAIPTVIDNKPLDFAEVMPEYIGGAKAMARFFRKNLRYPHAEKATGTEGTVFVRFVVDENGHVTNIEVIRSASGGLDKEAARVIAMMPDWKPGLQHNSAVSVRMVVPIKFAFGNQVE